MCISESYDQDLSGGVWGVSGDAYCITGNSILLSQYMSLSDDIILMVMKTTGGDVGGLQYELNCVLGCPTIN